MSQSTITSFFNSRKRPASEDIHTAKSKVLHLENDQDGVNNVQLTPNVGETFRNVKFLNKKSIAETKRSQRKAVTKLTFDTFPEPPISCDQPKEHVANHSTASLKRKVLDEAKSATPSKAKLNIESNNAMSENGSINELKKKLKGHPRFAELKANASKLSSRIKLLKEASQKKIKKFTSIELEVPISPTKICEHSPRKGLMSPRKDVDLTPKKDQPEPQTSQLNSARNLISPRKVVVSPIKSPAKVPAYIRHASLATSTTKLPLPHHYRLLGEIFRGMETVCSLFFNRKENITFNKVKISVQEMVKHNFTFKHLAQIKYLAPEMYKFELQKVKQFAITSKKDAYELYITPSLVCGSTVMTPKVLLDRRRKFYDRMLTLVKRHHADFLLDLDPPMVIPDDKLTRWHPDFDLEKVEEVTEGEVPLPPNFEKISTAEEVLSKARHLLSCNTRMERALENLARAKARGFTEKEKTAIGLKENSASQTEEPSPSNVGFLNPALRNLPPALLAKVKAKQAAKALEAMTRSTEDEKKALVYSRLPDLARTLRNVFVTERKNVISLKVVLSKLDNSFKSKVSAGELENDLKILSETLPKWLSLQEVRNTTYLKLDKSVNMEIVRSKLDELAKKYNN